MNFSLASTLLELDGMPSDHAHSQLPRLPLPASGASAKPTLSATWLSSALVTKEAATVASIHMPHLPDWNSARFSLKPFDEAPGGPASFIRST